MVICVTFATTTKYIRAKSKNGLNENYCNVGHVRFVPLRARNTHTVFQEDILTSEDVTKYVEAIKMKMLMMTRERESMFARNDKTWRADDVWRPTPLNDAQE